jgi:hypothetical protein
VRHDAGAVPDDDDSGAPQDLSAGAGRRQRAWHGADVLGPQNGWEKQAGEARWADRGGPCRSLGVTGRVDRDHAAGVPRGRRELCRFAAKSSIGNVHTAAV